MGERIVSAEEGNVPVLPIAELGMAIADHILIPRAMSDSLRSIAVELTVAPPTGSSRA